MDTVRGWEKYYRESGDRRAWKSTCDETIDSLRKLRNSWEGATVADLGSGDGRNAWPWLEAKANVLCVDISETALKKIKETATQQHLRSPILLQGDVRALRLTSGQFDLIQCFDTLSQVDDIASCLREINRLLSLSGIAAFNVFTPNDAAFGEGEMIDANSFVYRDTLFRFYDRGVLDPVVSACLNIVSVECKQWTDPPHIPFRPYDHVHEALYYVCRRL